MSVENPHERNDDDNMLVKTANAAVLTVSYRIAVLLLVGLVGLFGNRFLAQIDKMEAGLEKLSLVVVKASTTIDNIAKRVDVLEARERLEQHNRRVQ